MCFPQFSLGKRQGSAWIGVWRSAANNGQARPRRGQRVFVAHYRRDQWGALMGYRLSSCLRCGHRTTESIDGLDHGRQAGLLERVVTYVLKHDGLDRYFADTLKERLT